MATVDEDNAVAVANIPVCRSTARALTRHRPWDFDESCSVAAFALAEAIRTHEPARGEIESHIKAVVRRRILDYLESERPKGQGGGRHNLKLISEHRAVPLSSVPDADEQMLDRGPGRIGWTMEFEDWVRTLAKRLPPRHGELLVLHYLHADAESLDGCAARMGLKKARVVQIHRESLSMLRGEIPERRKPRLHPSPTGKRPKRPPGVPPQPGDMKHPYITWIPRDSVWQAKFRTANGELRHVGMFATQEEALRAQSETAGGLYRGCREEMIA